MKIIFFYKKADFLVNTYILPIIKNLGFQINAIEDTSFIINPEYINIFIFDRDLFALRTKGKGYFRIISEKESILYNLNNKFFKYNISIIKIHKDHKKGLSPEKELTNPLLAIVNKISLQEKLKNTDIAIQKCSDLHSTLLSQGGFYAKGLPNQMQISPDFIEIDKAMLDKCKKNGELLIKLLEDSFDIYLESLKNNNSYLQWFKNGIEGPVSDVTKSYQRKISLIKGIEYPNLFRPDLTSFFYPVEIQFRLGGLGIFSSWDKAIKKVFGTEGLISNDTINGTLATAIRTSTKKENPFAILITPNGYEEEHSYLSNILRTENNLESIPISTKTFLASMKVINKKIYYNSRQVDYLYRREMNLESLCQSPNGIALVEAYLEGNIIIEPPLNMLYDGKMMMTVPWEDSLNNYIKPSDLKKYKEIIPPTVIFNPKQIETKIGNTTFKTADILNKDYIIKYGGGCIYMGGFGGVRVFKSKKNKFAINTAIENTKHGHPWLLQEIDKTRNIYRQYKNNKLYPYKMSQRIMLFYSFYNKNLNLFSGFATNRPNNWKAIGNKDSSVHLIKCI